MLPGLLRLASVLIFSCALFLLAHKAFILNDREQYVLNHLKAEINR